MGWREPPCLTLSFQPPSLSGFPQSFSLSSFFSLRWETTQLVERLDPVRNDIRDRFEDSVFPKSHWLLGEGICPACDLPVQQPMSVSEPAACEDIICKNKPILGVKESEGLGRHVWYIVLTLTAVLHNTQVVGTCCQPRLQCQQRRH